MVLNNSLTDYTASDLILAGGKGFNLIRLQNGGFPVPPFTIIPIPLISRMMQPIQPQIAQMLTSINTADPLTMVKASAAIQGFIHKTEIPEEITRQITTFTDQHPTMAFAVRSSVSAEDQRETSFAGLFKTLLHVAPSEISDAIKGVVSSLYSPEVMRYTTGNRLNITDLSMAVVVQVMAEAEVSGILFTMNPTGNMSQMMISAGYGYGEGVVNNTTDTATYLVERQTGAIFQTANPELLNPLSGTQIGKLKTMALAIEQHFGYPQDIEFSVTKGGEIVILQSRDITTIDLEKLRILDNTNISESYPGITLPLTFDFALGLYKRVFAGTIRYFRPPGLSAQDLDEPLSQMIAHVNGRVYYQLHHWYRLISIVNPAADKMREWEKFIGIQSPVRPAATAKPGKKLRMAFTALSLLLRYRFIMRLFYRRFQKVYTPLRAWTDRLADLRPDRVSILQTYTRASEQLVRCWPATLLNDFFVSRHHAALGRFVQRHTGTDDGSITQGLLCGITGVESEWPVMAMLELKLEVLKNPELKLLFSKTPPEILAALEQPAYTGLWQRIQHYQALYGDRTLEELKLETPNFRQHPGGLIQLLQSQLTGDSTPETFRSRQQEIRTRAEREMTRALAGKPFQRLWYRFLLRNTKAAIRNRENMRLRRTRAYGAVKEIFAYAGELMAQAGVLADGRDVFFLRISDLMAYLERGDGSSFRVQVEQAKQELIRWKNLEMPDRIIWQGDNIPSFEGTREAPHTAGGLSGLGISKGIVTAEAIVLDHPDYDAPVDGKILVSRSTDPGWVFLMTRAAGIISEKGSPLSHTAIVGRELGIPVIVGVNNATRIIQTGQIITMDGEKGDVTM